MIVDQNSPRSSDLSPSSSYLTTSPHAYSTPPTLSPGAYLSPAPAATGTTSSSSLSSSPDPSTTTTTSTSQSSITPLLTPTTRAEAEAALSSNSFFQTSAAAPSTTATAGSTIQFLPNEKLGDGVNGDLADDDDVRERISLLHGNVVRRPMAYPRSNSSRYEDALRTSVTVNPIVNVSEVNDVRDGTNAGRIGTGTEGEGLEGRQNSRAGFGLRFSRQPGCITEDMKRMLSERLMREQRMDTGYFSTAMG